MKGISINKNVDLSFEKPTPDIMADKVRVSGVARLTIFCSQFVTKQIWIAVIYIFLIYVALHVHSTVVGVSGLKWHSFF